MVEEFEVANWPSDGTCCNCGAAPRSPETGLCATCEDGPCTDCDDTGMTIQTERPCACSAGDQYRTPVANTSNEREGHAAFANGKATIAEGVEDVVVDDPHLIRRNGAFFRPNAAGYTNHIAAAGIYSRTEAEGYLSAEGVSIHPISEYQADAFAAIAGAQRILAALSPSEGRGGVSLPDREEIARVIDPEAFADPSRMPPIDIPPRKRAAPRTADAILALRPSRDKLVEALKQAVAGFVDIAWLAQNRIDDGDEIGERIWRLALGDIQKEANDNARAALAAIGEGKE